MQIDKALSGTQPWFWAILNADQDVEASTSPKASKRKRDN